MDQIQEEFQPSRRNSEVMTTFGYRLYNQFSMNKSFRRPKELQWLEDLRTYKGVYDPDVNIDPDNSHVYPKITRAKVNIVLSRLHEMLFPEVDRNFEILRTPEPSIPKPIVNEIIKSIIKQDEQTGQYIMPTSEQIERAIKDFSDVTAKKMESVIDDQLKEMVYPEETKKVLRSGLIYGTGVMEGPLATQKSKRKWEYNQEINEYEEKIEFQDAPLMEFTRIWDWYPDMSVSELQYCGGYFKRGMFLKSDLRKLAKRKDFYGDIIFQYLTDHPDGDYVPEAWELDLQQLEVEAGTDDKTVKVTTSTSGGESISRSTYRQQGKRYEILQFWGFIDGADLAACGVTNLDGTEIDVKLEYAANIWMLGKQVIKAILFDGALNHYKVFYYEKDETSIFGEGLCRIMRHSQIGIASAARMVLDNGACVSGPQVEINWDLMHPGTDLNSFYPRKLWFRQGRGMEAQYPALRALNFDSHIEELMAIAQFFQGFADIETCLPTWMLGDKVNNENSKQTSGRQSEILVSIKDIVRNFDAFTENVIRDLYAWNMEFNERTDIKGDFRCVPLGVSSLVMKEIRMAAITNLKNTLDPEDWAYIPRRELLEETLKVHDIRIKLRTEEEAAEYRQSQVDQRAMDLGYAQAEAEVAYKKAQTAGQLTKAKKFNVEAEKDANTPPETNPATDPRLADAEIAKKNTEISAQNEQIRRDEESHQQKLLQSDEQHRLNTLKTAVQADHDESIKERKAQHDLKMREKDMEIKEKTSKQQKSKEKK